MHTHTNTEHPTPEHLAPEYLTPQELSERYRGRITVRTLANWRCNGEGPRFRKIGGRILYPMSAVLEWERKREAGSTSGYARA